jgi:hypothetical protein
MLSLPVQTIFQAATKPLLYGDGCSSTTAGFEKSWRLAALVQKNRITALVG